ncbi:hypothetical protein [Helcococcus kunzii]|uniref:hypothetical protein n=1 Tax=Helcococcus kunzii TaxID=40091 RepID=UPI001BB09E2F|nr:hypothetical protein [Helcococcus kunzii]MCT1796912.1 hypothetical protein [Helcococcus kunzii]MCT1988530.1 hypothetical protein [Helcococcus kunzii]QUY65628.1 hypothetical protein GUI37_08875 [Helcococcus kunzii]
MEIIFCVSIFLTFILAALTGKNNEKNSKSVLLTVLVLIDLVLGGYYLYIYIPKFLKNIIDYIINSASKLDVVVIVALITGLVTIINSIYSKYSENNIRRIEYLTEKREKSYTDFINFVYKAFQNEKNGFKYSQEDMIKDMNEFSSQLSLWGSPNVVKKWIEFRKKSINQIQGDTTILLLLEEVINEMRNDLRVRKLKKGNILSIIINDIENIIK